MLHEVTKSLTLLSDGTTMTAPQQEITLAERGFCLQPSRRKKLVFFK